MINCDPSNQNNQEKDKQELDKLSKEIHALADNSVCSPDYTCKYIGMGSKPCGGVWGYLIYSTSINEDDLTEKVKHYNNLEREYNENYGIISDCSMAMRPHNLECEDGKCKAVYK
jgi:hypothetical protein